MTAATTSITPALQALLDTVRPWTGVRIRPRAPGVLAFVLNTTEIGHLHPAGRLDIPFPERIAAVLRHETNATRHPIDEKKNWVVLRIDSVEDVPEAVRLLRLAYIYRRIVRSDAAAEWQALREELATLDVPPAVLDRYQRVLARRRGPKDGAQ
ncbi:luciferase domain-containing protein [Salisaeta longa]|uniref:luciferase domain-containing protein n=1 Tax=Salisaeta longa TaxID=503170 RepID=UPI0003B49C01|nr:luciferase family protein [Salisaeta longa]